MKLAHTISASVLAVIVLSNTGCSITQQDEPAPSETSQISANKYGDQHGNPIPSYRIKATDSPVAPPLPKPPVVPKVKEDSSEEEMTVEEDESLASIDDSAILDDTASEEPMEEDVSVEAQEAADAAEAVKIVSTVNDFYTFTLNPASYDQIIGAGARFKGREEVSEEELVQFAADHASLFRYFDTSSAESIQNAYRELAVSSAVGKTVPGMTISIPVKAVTVYGDSASIDNSMATVARDGKDYSAQYSEISTGTIDLIKLSNGTWVVQAQSVEQ